MEEKIFLEKPNFDAIPGGYEDLSKSNILSYSFDRLKFRDVYDEVAVIDNFLTLQQIFDIQNFMKTFPIPQNVSVSGMISNIDMNRIGSVRNTVYSKQLSLEFTNKISTLFKNSVLTTDDKFPSDIWQNVSRNNVWEFEGISPMFRFMTYKSGGEHVPHYDASYIYNFDNSYRTLYSFVLYLTTNKTGSTRFIKDNQEYIQTKNRDHSDWERLAIPQEVLYEEFPVNGKMLIFPHRMCHDVSKFLPENTNEIRQIIRGDLIFKEI